MKYYTEGAVGKSLRGIIVCGSRIGYEGSREYNLEQALSFLDDINQEITAEGLSPIPCIVIDGILVGRSDAGSYHENVYKFNFSWSPRVPVLEESMFYT